MPDVAWLVCAYVVGILLVVAVPLKDATPIRGSDWFLVLSWPVLAPLWLVSKIRYDLERRTNR